MKKCIIFLVLFFLSISGCASGVKYTIEEIKDFPEPIQTSIKKGEVIMGMTSQQTRYAWGSPDKVSTSYKEGKHRELWIYTSFLGLSKQTYLFFEDGKLVFWTIF
ncbi:MAG: hypothetical protein AABY44_06095 [Nitrospirota bacterium]